MRKESNEVFGAALIVVVLSLTDKHPDLRIDKLCKALSSSFWIKLAQADVDRIKKQCDQNDQANQDAKSDDRDRNLWSRIKED